ncbi:hypothetical protein ACFSKU_02660 [Pontibacter silvestris]|uniref:DUF1440 domain-containing protein n=1 Tax=Pontibacter silvestris TaxID=2305183 RepID=A0ABW4WSN4_9BACT|nr:hypothetical protein [Pontibacter silvestris]MCC9137703.1 hypothetical protein [Pontibacter silvestris]
MNKNYIAEYEDRSVSVTARVAGAVGRGLVAGLLGTAAMTVAQMIEMKLSGRGSSDTPYQAVKKVFGIKAESDEDKETITNFTHFAYGTAWGVPRALLAEFGATGVAGTLAHFGAVWGTEITVLPSMDVEEPITTWKPKAISEDALMHGIYATATGLVADALTKSSR